MLNKYKELTEEYYKLLRENDRKNYCLMQQISAEISRFDNEYPHLSKMLDKNKIIRKVLKNFLKDDYEDYKNNTAALKIWADMLKKPEIMYMLNILTESDYDSLFEYGLNER